MASSNKNSARLKSSYAKYIAEIVQREIKNPKLGMVSVNEVVLNEDNSVAKVYVTFLGAKYPRQALEELKKSEGFVRSRLAKKVSVYKVPEVRFIYDESYDRFDRIEAALKKEQDKLDSFPNDDEDEDN